MKKDYNRDVMSDMPVDASFTTTKTSSTRSQPAKSKTTTISKRGATAKPAGKQTSSKTTSKTATKTSSSSKTATKETSKELKDLEKINEESLSTHQFKSKRNKVVIVLLIILLLISCGAIVAIVSIFNLKNNCNMILHGNVNAVYVVDGIEMSEFRTPANLKGNITLQLDIKIKINQADNYNIKFIPLAYQNGKLMENTLVYKHNMNLFYEGSDGYYYSKQPISGNQTIALCEGVILDYYYEDSLNADNFKLEFHTYFEKV